MTRLERYKEQLAELQRRKNRLLQNGDYVKALRLASELKEIEELIKEAEKFEPKPLREMVTDEQLKRMGIIPKMIECHLIADLLVDATYEIVDACRAEGFEAVSFIPELDEIIKKSEKFAAFLTKLSPQLCGLLVRNETLNASLHKKYQKYISQRLTTKNNEVPSKES